jgi:hypothetical protein
VIGGGIRWAGPQIFLWPISGCDWGKFVQTGISAHDAADGSFSRVVVIKRGDPSRAIQLTGASGGGAPSVRVSGAGFPSLDSPAGSGPAWNPKTPFRILRDEAHDLTVVGLEHPKPGTYRIDALPGSPPVASVAEARDPGPARITGTVTGEDTARVLHYGIRRRPDQKVTFVEVAGASRKVIGSVSGGGRGTLRFISAPGRDQRTIEASIELAGVPAPDVFVTHFRPAAPRLGRPAGLQIARRGTSLRVTWNAVAHAARYEVVVTTTSAGQRSRTVHRAAVVLRGVPAFAKGTVSVRALDAFRQSPTAVARFSAAAPAPTRFRPLPRPPRLR